MVLDTVRNISFLSIVLELYSEITLIFFLKMTDTVTSQNTDLPSSDILYKVEW
jgi:hypothetical protein